MCVVYPVNGQQASKGLLTRWQPVLLRLYRSLEDDDCLYNLSLEVVWGSIGQGGRCSALSLS